MCASIHMSVVCACRSIFARSLWRRKRTNCRYGMFIVKAWYRARNHKGEWKVNSVTRSNLKLFPDSFLPMQTAWAVQLSNQSGEKHSEHSALWTERQSTDDMSTKLNTHKSIYLVFSHITQKRKENSWISRSGLNLFRHRDKQNIREFEIKASWKDRGKRFGSIRLGHIWCVFVFFRSALSPSSPLCLERARASGEFLKINP
jgi:hypothetical protein